METQTEQKAEPVEKIAQEAVQVTEKQQEETPEQINWKKFREQREMERKQREQAEKVAAEKSKETEALKAALEAIVNKPSTNSTHFSENQYENESEDEKIEKKVKHLLEQRDRQYDEKRRQEEQAQLPQKLAQTYSDFTQVCNQENLDYLEYHYPEVARAFSQVPDSFQKWSDVYNSVKKFVPNLNSKKDQAKAEKNFNKPQSMTVPGVTQVGDTAPIILDDKRRADNWARMQKVMKGAR